MRHARQRGVAAGDCGQHRRRHSPRSPAHAGRVAILPKPTMATRSSVMISLQLSATAADRRRRASDDARCPRGGAYRCGSPRSSPRPRPRHRRSRSHRRCAGARAARSRGPRGSTGALSRNEARNAASITLPIERMNRLPEAFATAMCRARSASAKPTESEASRRIRSMLRRSSAISASDRRAAASAAARGSTARRISARSLRKRLSMPASRCQASTSASNMFQAPRSRTTVPTRALVVSSPLATSVLTLSRSTGRDTPNIAISSASPGRRAPFGIAAGDDVDADAAGDLRVVGMGAPRRDDDDARGHDLTDSCAFRAPAGAPARRMALLQGDEGEQQDAGHDLGPPARQRPVEIDVGLDQALDQHAEEGADHRALPAREQRAADHHGGDGVEFDADRRERIAGRGVEGEHDAGDACKHARQHVDAHRHRADRQRPSAPRWRGCRRAHRHWRRSG